MKAIFKTREEAVKFADDCFKRMKEKHPTYGATSWHDVPEKLESFDDGIVVRPAPKTWDVPFDDYMADMYVGQLEAKVDSLETDKAALQAAIDSLQSALDAKA